MCVFVRSVKKDKMKIKATYIHEDQAYIIQVDEQYLNVPSELMPKLLSAVEVAYSRRKHTMMEALARSKAKRLQAAKIVVEEANHPDVLPFTQDRPPSKPPGRPPGIRYTAPIEKRLKKQKPRKPKPPENEVPFKHIKYT